MVRKDNTDMKTPGRWREGREGEPVSDRGRADREEEFLKTQQGQLKNV